jgi:large subunit ribosomal protein L30
MNAPVQSLFITLKRSFAGTREHHIRILQSLGFRHRQQTVEKPNVAHIRGAVDKASCRFGRACD